MFAYLTQKKIFINVDQFGSKEVASPGCIIKIHPQIIRKEDLQKELSSSLQSFEIHDNKIICEWQQRKIAEGPNIIDNDVTMDSDKEDHSHNIIPKFTLRTSSR
eukprot:8817628-Ditylum_brightwellii.AAC.1